MYACRRAGANLRLHARKHRHGSEKGYYSARPGGEGSSTVGLNQNERAQVGGGAPNVYVEVESIDGCLARAQELGGSVTLRRIPC